MTVNLTKPLRLLLLTAMAFAVAGAGAKEVPDTISARRAFVDMPATVLELLPRSTRLDMLDFNDADSVYYAINERDGRSRLDTVTPDYVKVEVTPASDFQIKVFKDRKGNDIVMTIYTVGAEGDSRDSDIRFYNTRLEELDRNALLQLPQMRDFFEIPKGSLTKWKEIEELIPFYTVDYQASPGSDEITGQLTIGEFMNLEDMKLVSLFMKPGVRMAWDGKKLKYQK